MAMSIRERILAVYRGETPDVVPCMLDLSHWFYQRRRLPWDLSRAYLEPERALIDYHRQQGVGFYMPNLASFFDVSYPDDVRAETVKTSVDGREAIVWRFRTRLGSIQRVRVWEDNTYAWATQHWGIRGPDELRSLGEALGRRTFRPRWERFQGWQDYVGDLGVVYLPLGYSGMGQLLNYWMGIQQTMYAICDWPDVVAEVVAQINANTLELVDLLAASPADVIVMGDNFSSDVQPPHFFRRWSQAFYRAAVDHLHAAGKHVAVHIDGRLRGALQMIAETGADCADAVTPAPLGDLTPEQCRAEAGPTFMLSGGVSPELWLPSTSDTAFCDAAIRWLELRKQSPRLILAAGDQVPPDAAEHRIGLLRDLAERHGRN